MDIPNTDLPHPVSDQADCLPRRDIQADLITRCSNPFLCMKDGCQVPNAQQSQLRPLLFNHSIVFSLSLGSKRSRSPSPRKLKDNTVIIMAKPGKIVRCGAVCK